MLLISRFRQRAEVISYSAVATRHEAKGQRLV